LSEEGIWELIAEGRHSEPALTYAHVHCHGKPIRKGKGILQITGYEVEVAI
jgi:hypothetical protein